MPVKKKTERKKYGVNPVVSDWNERYQSELMVLITLRKLGSEILRATGTPSIQILVTIYYCPLKRTRDPWKNR